MVRAQIQIPHRLYEEIKRVAREEETSLTEVVRRAVGDFLRARPEAGRRAATWAPPVIRDPGRILAREPEWRTLANETELPGDLRSTGKPP